MTNRITFGAVSTYYLIVYQVMYEVLASTTRTFKPK